MYEVVIERSINSLKEKVSELLSSGFVLSGGIAQGIDIYGKHVYMQAMLKTTKEVTLSQAVGIMTEMSNNVAEITESTLTVEEEKALFDECGMIVEKPYICSWREQCDNVVCESYVPHTHTNEAFKCRGMHYCKHMQHMVQCRESV